MEPTIKAGDMVVTRLIPLKNIATRDIVVLPLPESPSIRYAHRIISVERGDAGVNLKTKGDANPNPDSWNLEVRSKKVTQVMAVIPTARIFSGAIERKWIYVG